MTARLLVQAAVPNHLGDAVMALPSLRRLVAALPHCEIRLVGRALPARVLDGQGPWAPVASHWIQRRGSAAVLLAASLRVGIAARRARASVVVGTRVDARRWLLSHPVDGSIQRLHQRTLYERTIEAAVRALGGVSVPSEDTSFEVDPRGEAWWARSGRPKYLLHPWAEGLPAKRWSTARWIELGRELGSVAVTGGPGSGDAGMARAVADALGAPCAAGVDTLSPAAWGAVAQRVARAVLPDTGLAHLASAAGAEPVVLFGATDPSRYAPTRAKIVRAASMASIQVAHVLAAARA